MSLTHRLRTVGAAALLTLAGCATPIPVAGPSVGEGFPLTVTNCGQPVVFQAPPERIVMLESAPVTILDGLGVLDRVIARAGAFPDGYYDADLTRRVAVIEMMSDELDASGHLMISPEAVLALQPDLVLGLPDGVTREALHDGGATALVQPVFCSGNAVEATFGSLYEQILTYGRIFDRTDQADALVASLQARVTAVEKAAAGEPRRTAAVLYPSAGGGPLYAYGRASMAHPQLAAAGLQNVFGDSAERVFEVNPEELIARNPDVLILLHSDNAGVIDEVASLPGSEGLRALRNGDVLEQLFNFTEPPTPLAVDGLERIAAWLRAS